MELILLEKVENLGNIGDLVKVRAGYGRNFLLPQRKAARATAENITAMEARRAELELLEKDELKTAQARATKFESLTLSIAANAGPEGRLFGSVGPVDIAEAATEAGVEVQRSEVRMPDGPLHNVGEFSVDIHLASDVNVAIKVVVVGQEAENLLADLDEGDAVAEAPVAEADDEDSNS
jgi:large subunit ribosomal protein L9